MRLNCGYVKYNIALGRDGGDIARVRTHEAHAFRLRAIVLSRDAMLRAFLAFQVERIKCIRHPRIVRHKQIDPLSICHGGTSLAFELCRAFHVMLRQPPFIAFMVRYLSRYTMAYSRTAKAAQYSVGSRGKKERPATVQTRRYI